MLVSYENYDKDPGFRPRTLHIHFERASEVDGIYKLFNSPGSSEACKKHNVSTENIKKLLRDMYPELKLIGKGMTKKGGLLVP